MAAPHPDRQRTARARLADLFARADNVFVIHYACQSFNQPQASGSPRVASIAARNLSTGQTESFSINQQLELAGIDPSDAFRYMDFLEKGMLDKFYAFLAEHRKMSFVHWNMRDSKFGFAAIDHRYSVLGGLPVALSEHQRFDLAIQMCDVYGSSYIDKPHLENLAKRNGLSLRGFVSGRDEPLWFNRGDFSAVHQSTLCKVTLMSDIARRMFDRTLRTDATWWTLNTGRVRESCEMLEDNPVKALVGTLPVALSFGFWLVTKLI